MCRRRRRRRPNHAYPSPFALSLSKGRSFLAGVLEKHGASTSSARTENESTVPPLRPHLVPPCHALGDALFHAAVGGGVEGLGRHFLGPVIVARKTVFGVVV